METLLDIGITNAVSATVLALVALVSSRWIKRPAVVHTLWLLVLLKLIAPPIVPFGVLPRASDPPIPSARAETAPSEATEPMISHVLAPGEDVPASFASERPVTLGTPPKDAGRAWRDFLPLIAVVLWGGGAVFMLAMTIVRTRRAVRFMTLAVPASWSVQAATRVLAARMGLARAPAVRMVPVITSPMLWAVGKRPEIVLPAPLVERLSTSERDALIAHELAHLRRRDHWVRYVELVAVCLFWWFPVMWWARSRMRHAEERCCDDLVLGSLPGQGPSYVRALLETLHALSGSTAAVPSLASGVGRLESLEERLTMIMKNRTRSPLPRAMRLPLAAAAVGAVLVFPTWAEHSDEPSASDDDIEITVEAEEQSPSESPYQEALLELERARAQLDLQMQEIQAQRLQVEHDLQRAHVQKEMQALREAAAECEADGRLDEAEKLRSEAETMERHLAIQQERYLLQKDAVDRTAEIEYALRAKELEVDVLASRGENGRVEELVRESDALRRDLERLHAELQTREFGIQRTERMAEIEEAEARVRALREQGRHHDAEQMEIGIERRRAELALHGREAALIENRRQVETRLREIERLTAAREVEERRRGDGPEESEHALLEAIKRLEERIGQLESRLDAVDTPD